MSTNILDMYSKTGGVHVKSSGRHVSLFWLKGDRRSKNAGQLVHDLAWHYTCTHCYCNLIVP